MSDRWTEPDPDDDVEVFVIDGTDDDASGPTIHPQVDVDALGSTLTSADVAGDDWADTSWLDELDEPIAQANEVVAEVDMARSTASDDRMGDVLRTIGAGEDDDRTDVTALLRELSMLVVED